MAERSNAWVVKNLKHKAKRKSELRRLEAQYKRIAAQIEKRSKDLHLLGQAEEVYEGVAIYDWGHDDRHRFGRVVGEWHGEVFPNAHNKGETYGVVLRDLTESWQYGDWRTPRGNGGLFMGNQFTYDEAIHIAKQFVAHGIWDKS